MALRIDHQHLNGIGPIASTKHYRPDYHIGNLLMITGCHRSGTSVVAYICSKLGIELGSNLFEGPKFSNPDGHFEDIDFMNIHDRILLDNHMLWHNISKAFVIDRYNDILKSLKNRSYWFLLYKQKIHEFLPATLCSKIKTIFGYKDPRLTVMLDVICDKLIRDRLYLPVVILCWRNPYDIALSLVKRDHFTLSKAIDVAGSYQYMLSNIMLPYLIKKQIPVINIRFEELVRKPRVIVPQIAKFLATAVPDIKETVLDDVRIENAISIVRVRN